MMTKTLQGPSREHGWCDGSGTVVAWTQVSTNGNIVGSRSCKGRLCVPSVWWCWNIMTIFWEPKTLTIISTPQLPFCRTKVKDSMMETCTVTHCKFSQTLIPTFLVKLLSSHDDILAYTGQEHFKLSNSPFNISNYKNQQLWREHRRRSCKIIRASFWTLSVLSPVFPATVGINFHSF